MCIGEKIASLSVTHSVYCRSCSVILYFLVVVVDSGRYYTCKDMNICSVL
jgi:hypothetical protein